jgi:hypothetical protein
MERRAAITSGRKISSARGRLGSRLTKLVGDRGRARQAHGGTDLAHAGRVAARLDLVAQELQHLALSGRQP